MILTIIAIISLYTFLYWAYKNEGVSTSISAYYYIPKTSATYAMVLSLIGVLILLSFHQGYNALAGASLILGTAAPNFKHKYSLSKYFHFSFTGATALLAWCHIGGCPLGIIAVILLVTAKIISLKASLLAKKDNALWYLRRSVYFAELLLFTVALWGTLIKLIVG